MARIVVQKQDFEQALKPTFDEIEEKIAINYTKLNSIEHELFDDYNYDNIRNKVRDLSARMEQVEWLCDQVHSRRSKGAKITITKGKNVVKVRV